MLINFFVSNFRSIRDELQLNMAAGGRHKSHLDHRIPILGSEKHALKVAVIYGANAAGKSNIVRAIDFARDMVVNSANTIRRLSTNQFARRTDKPSSFQFQFQADGYQFDFGFDIQGERVVGEWLYIESSEHSRRECLVYKRENGETEIGKLNAYDDGKATVGMLQTLKSLGIKEGELLLNKVLESSSEERRGSILNAAIFWFTESLTIVQPRSSYVSLLSFLESNSNFREWSTEFLSSVSTGISKLRVETTPISADSIPSSFVEGLQSGASSIPLGPGIELSVDENDSSRVVRKNLKSAHVAPEGAFELPFSDESDGTQRFLELLPALYLSDNRSGKRRGPTVYVIDELDRSLHPVLSHAFLKFFTDSSKDKKDQLIITTHETYLLDRDLLRRDEIWFVEKGDDQGSKLVSLTDFKVRNDLRLERGYLHGRFGGIPFVGNLEKLFEWADAEDEVVH